MALLFIKDYLHDNRNYIGYYKEICIYKKKLIVSRQPIFINLNNLIP